MMMDVATIPAGLANRMLRGETWARDRLALHAGRVFSITVSPSSGPFHPSRKPINSSP